MNGGSRIFLKEVYLSDDKLITYFEGSSQKKISDAIIALSVKISSRLKMLNFGDKLEYK